MLGGGLAIQLMTVHTNVSRFNFVVTCFQCYDSTSLVLFAHTERSVVWDISNQARDDTDRPASFTNAVKMYELIK
jgi:hypothetical protein